MAAAAYLRIYLPSERLDEALEHLAEPVAPGRMLTSGEFGVWEESSRDDAFVIERKGRTYVCPRHPRLRMLEGLLAFRNAYQGSSAATLVPEAVADRAGRELDRIHARFPGVRSHILTSPFFVPLRWFAAFDADERELVDTGALVTIRYRTTVRSAVKRLRGAVAVLAEAGFDDVIVDQVTDVLRWVEAFPSEALLELDYGTVAALFSPAELAIDESAAEVRASLDALAADDFEQAGDFYAEAASRWAHAQSLAYAN